MKRILIYMEATFVDLVEGIYAGIPVCCIWFYVRETWCGTFHIARTVQERRGVTWQMYEYHKYKYVQCDHCFANDKGREQLKKGMLLPERWVHGSWEKRHRVQDS